MLRLHTHTVLTCLFYITIILYAACCCKGSSKHLMDPVKNESSHWRLQSKSAGLRWFQAISRKATTSEVVTKRSKKKTQFCSSWRHIQNAFRTPSPSPKKVHLLPPKLNFRGCNMDKRPPLTDPKTTHHLTPRSAYAVGASFTTVQTSVSLFWLLGLDGDMLGFSFDMFWYLLFRSLIGAIFP